MRRGWLWVALLLSLGVNVGVLATLGAGRARTRSMHTEPPREGGPPPFMRLANHLELAGEQREQFVEIQKALFQTTRRVRHQLEELRSELRQEVMRDDPDRERVDQLLQESGEANRWLDRAMVDSVLATREILTPAQQRRYFHVIERLRERSRRSGPRGGPPPRRPRRDP